MLPNAMMVLAQFSEINCIPRLPISRPVQPMTDETDPVSPFCCSSIRWTDGGRKQFPAIDEGRMHSAKIQGARFPSTHTSAALAAITIKQARMIASE